MKFEVEIDTRDMHDTVYNVNGKSLTEKELDELFMSFPDDIKYQALEWGFDTCVREKIYEHLESKKVDDIETSVLIGGSMRQTFKVAKSDPSVKCTCGKSIQYFDCDIKYQHIGYEEAQYIICPTCDKLITIGW